MRVRPGGKGSPERPTSKLAEVCDRHTADVAFNWTITRLYRRAYHVFLLGTQRFTYTNVIVNNRDDVPQVHRMLALTRWTHPSWKYVIRHEHGTSYGEFAGLFQPLKRSSP